MVSYSLQNHVVESTHTGHIGIEKTKTLLRQKVYLPFNDRLIEQKCKNCVPCLSVIPRNTPDPIKVIILPDRPWDEVSIKTF